MFYTIGDADERPWGRYSVIDVGENFAVKRIVVEQGKRLSLQRHRHRAERWIVVNGRGFAEVDGAELPMLPGEVIAIPKGVKHRMRAADDVAMELVEIQLGSNLAEDDIERLEDDFGRS